MEHHLEAYVGIYDAAMGAREAGHDIVPAPLQNIDCVEQLDLDNAFDVLNYAFGSERFEFRRAQPEILFIDLRVVLTV